MYRRIDRFSFYFGIIITGPVIILGLLINFGYFEFVHGYDLCIIHRLAGLYCPGCGMTRACFALFSGHFLRSLAYHVIPVCAVAIYLIYMAYLIRLRVSLKWQNLKWSEPYPEAIDFAARRFHKRLEIIVYITTGVTIVQWLLKDILLITKGIDLMKIIP